MTSGSVPIPRAPRDPRLPTTHQPTGPTGVTPETVEARLGEILSRYPESLSEEVGILEEAHRLLHDALA